MKIYCACNGSNAAVPYLVGMRVLCSYWYMRGNQRPKELMYMDDESIMDSGLFSLMFGSEKGTLPETFEAYEEYTKQYLEDVDKWGYKGFLVESDVHRLLGMDAVHRLRELYEPFGNRVIYVWHMPEGRDGLRKLAVERDYIAISVPELRMISSKGNATLSTIKVVPGLLNEIADACSKAGVRMPRVHLLGGTVKSLMQGILAYSSDSTSWLYGVRKGKATIYTPARGISQVSIRSDAHEQFLNYVSENYPQVVKHAKAQNSPSMQHCFLNMAVTATAYRIYQDWLDAHYDPIPLRF